MGGIARQKDPALTELLGDQFASRPRQDGDNFVVEIDPYGSPNGVAHFTFGQFSRVIAAAHDGHTPLVSSVYGNDGRPGAGRGQKDEPIAGPFVVQLFEFGVTEDHVGGVGKGRVAFHGNTQGIAYGACGTVTADNVLGFDAHRRVPVKIL